MKHTMLADFEVMQIENSRMKQDLQELNITNTNLARLGMERAAENERITLKLSALENAQAEAKKNLETIVDVAATLYEAIQFCKSVIKSNGVFEASERLAIEKAEKAIEKADGLLSEYTPTGIIEYPNEPDYDDHDDRAEDERFAAQPTPYDP